MRKEIKKRIALTLTVALGIFLIYALLPFTSAFFGALILYVLFLPVFRWLCRKKLSKKLSAIVILILATIVLIIPLLLITAAIINQASSLNEYRDEIMNYIEGVDDYLKGIDLSGIMKDQTPRIISTLQDILIGLFTGFSSASINILIMYFLLYYMLMNSNKLHKKALELIPFNKKNSNRLVDEVSTVTKSTIITSGLIALLQGVLIGIGFLIFGLPGAIFWGFVGFFLSFLPVVGVSLIWIAVSIILLVQGRYWPAAGFLLWGLFTNNIDNLLRPYIQNKVGRIHPLVVLIGVFMGIPIFGIMGLIIGPLLLSYFLLISGMFIKEYTDGLD
jgi:predicted PurR-regulated permease PerM